jgi:hypothetical protein
MDGVFGTHNLSPGPPIWPLTCSDEILGMRNLQAPRKHLETVDGVPYKLGQFLDNTRRRANNLAPERRAELTELGMRW